MTIDRQRFAIVGAGLAGAKAAQTLREEGFDGRGRVLAGMNVNVWDVTDPIQALIRGGRPVDERRLADPDVPLTDLVDVDERVAS